MSSSNVSKADTVETIDSATVALLSDVIVEGSGGGGSGSGASTLKSRSQHTANLNRKRKRRLSRRANLIGICGVTCLCVLLLIATSQHRPTTVTHAGTFAGLGSSSIVGTDRHLNFPPQTLVYNMTASITDVLKAQRNRIAVEMENFEYPAGRFGVDAEKLSELTPETKGMPVRSMVLTSWRSGSTFLGDILNAMPGNYYHYEPLLNFGIKQVRDQAEAAEALNNLKQLFNCNYKDMEEYLEYGRTHTYLFEHNSRLWSVCKEFPLYCWRAKFLTPFCQLFPLQSMKTVRLRLADAEKLLQDQSLNVRIILLVRDPRGTMQSRKHREWCAGNEDCDDAEVVCADLAEDYAIAEQLLKKFPSKFRTLRYEDLSLNPYEMTQDILQFYGLPFDPMVEEFLDTHTKVNIGGVSSTYRDSRSAPFHWKQDLRVEEIEKIQKHCDKAMNLWGYRQIDNFTDFQGTFDPISLPPPFT